MEEERKNIKWTRRKMRKVKEEEEFNAKTNN